MQEREVTRKQLAAELRRLDELERQGDIEALIIALRSPIRFSTLTARRAASHKLGSLRARQAADPLAELLGDTDAGVRASAARSLGLVRRRTPTVTAGLIETIRNESDEHVRALAIASLGEIGAPEVHDEVAPFLSSRSASVRFAAIYALSVIPDAAANRLADEQLARERWRPGTSKRRLRRNVETFRREGRR